MIYQMIAITIHELLSDMLWLLKMYATPLHDLGRSDSCDHDVKSKFLISEWII